MQGLSILVVEPDPKFRLLVSRRLEVDGHQITDVSDGRSALRALRDGIWQMLWVHPSREDVSWEEIAHEARATLPDCFITLLSDAVDWAQQLREPGVDAVLPRTGKDAGL